MRQTFAIALLQFRLALKSKGTLFMMFAMPLMMTAIFGLMLGSPASGGQSVPIAVVDQDNSFASRQLVQALERDPFLRVQTVSQDELTRLFADKEISSGVVIPAGFEQAVAGSATPQVDLITPPGGNQQVAVRPAVLRQVARVAQDYRLAAYLAGGAAGTDKLKQAYNRVAEERANLTVAVAHEVLNQGTGTAGQRSAAVGQTAMGFTVMFVMMMVLMMSGVILQERQNGTWGRLLTAPATRFQVLMGYVLSFFMTGMFQFAVLVVAGRLLFRVNWGPLPQLAAMAGVIVLCSAGLGMFLAGVVRSAEQQRLVGALVVVATSMLGGVYWPLDAVSPLMRRIGYLTPQAWAMDGFREVMLRSASWSALSMPILVLLGISALFMAFGVARVRFE